MFEDTSRYCPKLKKTDSRGLKAPRLLFSASIQRGFGVELIRPRDFLFHSALSWVPVQSVAFYQKLLFESSRMEFPETLVCFC